MGVYEALRGWGLQRGAWSFSPAAALGRVDALKAELAQHAWPSDARVVLTGTGLKSTPRIAELLGVAI